jgi:hypothetical protein
MLSRLGSRRLLDTPELAPCRRAKRCLQESQNHCESSSLRSAVLVGRRSRIPLEASMRSDWEPGELEEEKMQPGKSAVEARQRNKKRRLKRFGDQRTSETDQLSFLEKKSEQAATLIDYVDRVARFLLWASSLGLQVATIQLLDETAALYMNEEFFEGAPGTDASKLLAALGHQRQDLSRGATQLVRAHQAADGENFRRRSQGCRFQNWCWS